MVGAGQVARDDSGTPTEMYGVNYDITERKEAEAQIARAKAEQSEARIALHMARGETGELRRVVDGGTNFTTAQQGQAFGPVAEPRLGVHVAGAREPVLARAPGGDHPARALEAAGVARERPLRLKVTVRVVLPVGSGTVKPPDFAETA